MRFFSVERKNIIKKVSLSFGFLFLAGVFVYAAGGPFTPGFTLDPTCDPYLSPGVPDTDCVVTAGSGGGMVIGDPVASATAGSLFFADTNGDLGQDNANFFWDATSRLLGVGINSPGARIHSEGSFGSSSYISNQNKTINNSGYDNLSLDGNYAGSTSSTWIIQIVDDSVDPQLFRYSTDTGLTWSGDLPITAGYGSLQDGVEADFGTTTGYVNGDEWEFDVTAGSGSDVDALLLTVNGYEELRAGVNGIRFFDAYTFPFQDGNSGDVLTANGNGELSWQAPSGGGGGSSLIGFTDSSLRYNTAIGYAAGYHVQTFGTGELNTYMGSQAGYANNSGNNNVAFGESAGHDNSTGSNNIFVGKQSGAKSGSSNNYGSDLVMLGVNTGTMTGSTSNAIAIGTGATADNDQFALADSITSLKLRGVRWAMPSSQGGAGQVLKNDGGGNLTWQDDNTGGGGVTYQLYKEDVDSPLTSSVLSGSNAISIGQDNTANGFSSVSVGTGLFNHTYRSTIVGSYNELLSAPTSKGYGSSELINWYDDTPIFVIGNGTDALNKSNALTVLKNGQTGIGISNFPDTTTGDLFQVGGSGYFKDGLTTSLGRFNIDALGNFTKINNIDTVFPSSQGSNGQVLTNDGSGNLSWVTPNTGSTLIGSTSTLGHETWLGDGAGGSGASTDDTSFIGSSAGYGATDATRSIFLGKNSGRGAISANNSVFMGFYSGFSADLAEASTFIGNSAGYAADNASNSNFFGIEAGSSATNAKNSIFIGYRAGKNDLVNNTVSGTSILIGDNTSTGGYSNSIAIGKSAINTAAYQFALSDDITSWKFQGDSYTLPTSDGTSGQALTTDGSGVLTWATPSGGTSLVGSTSTSGTETWLGSGAGNFSSSTTNTTFIGLNAGQSAPNASNSNFIGPGAGGAATSASMSNFMGYASGSGASGASNSNFFGTNAGDGALSSSYSNFIGYQAGRNAPTASNAIFIGKNAGLNDTVDNTVSGTSILIGNSTSTGGYKNSIALGATATNTAANQFLIDDSYTQFNMRGVNYFMPSSGASSNGQVLTSDTSGNLSWATVSGWGLTGNSGTTAGTNFIGTTDAQDLVFKVNNTEVGRLVKGTGTNADALSFGKRSGNSATSATASVFLGLDAGNGATSAAYSNFMGQSAGSGATNGSYSNFFGIASGQNASSVSQSNFIGAYAGRNATSASDSSFIGVSAGNGATGASFSNFFGTSAGFFATGATQSNFFGYQAGYGATNADYSSFIGYRAGKSFIGNNVGSNNIIIGKDISLPNAATNSINIGAVLFGTGTNSTIGGDPSITPASGGKIGIGVVTPLDTLQVAGDIRTGTTGSNGCVKDFAGTGIVGTCSSDEDLKQDIQDLPELSDKFSQVRFVTYKWNDTAKQIYSNNTDVTNTGTIAQSVESQFPELVSRDDKGYRVVNYSGLLMYGMEAVKEVVSLADSFREKLVNWFADAANGIGDLFVKRVRTETLCVGTPGNETCITKEQLDNLLGGQTVNTGGNGGGNSSGGTDNSIDGGGAVTPDPDPIPDPTPILDPDPVADENPDPVPDPEPTTDPEPAPVLTE